MWNWTVGKEQKKENQGLLVINNLTVYITQSPHGPPWRRTTNSMEHRWVGEEDALQSVHVIWNHSVYVQCVCKPFQLPLLRRLLGNPSLEHSAGKRSRKGRLLFLNPFNVCDTTLRRWYLVSKYHIAQHSGMWLVSLWPVITVVILLLTFSFGQSAEIGVDHCQLKMLQIERREPF